jgi:hypothetical protein
MQVPLHILSPWSLRLFWGFLSLCRLIFRIKLFLMRSMFWLSVLMIGRNDRRLLVSRVEICFTFA